MQQNANWDFDLVLSRLAEAGSTLMRYQVPGLKPAQFRSSMPQVVPDLKDAVYRDVGARLRPPVPSANELTRMDQALGWIGIIPADMIGHKRLVGSRSLTDWRTGKPIYSWRQLGEKLGVDHKTAKAWHGLAIRLIVVQLNKPGLCLASGGKVGPGPCATGFTAQQLGKAVHVLEARRTAPA